MKKLSLLTVFILMMSMMVPVFATEITTETSKTVNVTYSTNSGYKITIPTDVDFSTPATLTQTVSATDVFLNYGETLNVKVSSTNYDTTWNLVDTTASTNKLAYSISCGGTAVASGAAVLSVPAGDTDGDEKNLTFAITGDENVAGTYKDTLTFTVSVDTASAN